LSAKSDVEEHSILERYSQQLHSMQKSKKSTFINEQAEARKSFTLSPTQVEVNKSINRESYEAHNLTSEYNPNQRRAKNQARALELGEEKPYPFKEVNRSPDSFVRISNAGQDG
jgi:hypothetical protein